MHQCPINCKLVQAGRRRLVREFELPFPMPEAVCRILPGKRVLSYPRVALLADGVPNAVADLLVRGVVIP